MIHPSGYLLMVSVQKCLVTRKPLFILLKCLEKLSCCINPTWHKLFFGGLDMGGARGAPPGKQPSGTFMSSNDLVTHQAHKNGQF